MPNKILNRPWAVGIKSVFVPVRFFPQGTTQLTKANWAGRGYTVSRTGVGAFTVTLDSRYRGVLTAVGPTLQQPTSAQSAKLTSSDVVAGTFTVLLSNISDNLAADVAANANTAVNLLLVLSDTSITGE